TRKLTAIRQHVTAQEMDLHALKAPPFIGDRKKKFMLRQRHMICQPSGIGKHGP
ncbi:MAG: hypothetical protein JWQ82_1463, partial [Tardiphaga sp.]|nr:hypothetical protein [Tardiphaga sp.]